MKEFLMKFGTKYNFEFKVIDMSTPSCKFNINSIVGIQMYKGLPIIPQCSISLQMLDRGMRVRHDLCLVESTTEEHKLNEDKIRKVCQSTGRFDDITNVEKIWYHKDDKIYAVWSIDHNDSMYCAYMSENGTVFDINPMFRT